MKNASIRGLIRVFAVLALAGAAAAACAQKPEPAPGDQPPSVVNAAAAERFRAAGKAASLTVLPTLLADRPMPPVGEVVAMMLERGGMTDLELPDAEFAPPPGADAVAAAKSLAEFVRANPPGTEYVLFTQFLGTPQEGVSEVRSIIATAGGEIALLDRQAKGDRDFDRSKPREPMQGCMLVADRLRPVLGLDDPAKAKLANGAVTKRWEAKTGLPDRAERDAMDARARAFRRDASNKTLLVYPAHAGDAYSAASAHAIAERINAKGLMKASASDTGPHFEIARSMNEQKTLWSMARCLSDHVKTRPQDADFILLTDYLMGAGGVGGVHFALCNRAGELVIVDFQNNHWEDFRSINPRTREDCDRLVVERLEGHCR